LPVSELLKFYSSQNSRFGISAKKGIFFVHPRVFLPLWQIEKKEALNTLNKKRTPLTQNGVEKNGGENS
jgi:hypothetical protein